MNVDGYNVPQKIIKACLDRMQAFTFRASNLETICVLAIPADERLKRPGLCNRLVDRLLQRERRAGHIRIERYPYWIWVGGGKSNALEAATPPV